MQYFLKQLFSVTNLPLLLAIFLLTVSVTLPPIELEQPVYRLQITFDVSQSMDVEDASNETDSASRLAFAKRAATGLLDELSCGSHVGLAVFTGRKIITLLTPVEICAHYAGLQSSLNAVTGSMRWSNGSAIGKGLHQSIKAASSFESKTAVVFISDGHEAPPLEPGQRGMPKTDQFEVNGILVGVGGDSPVPIPKSDEQGRFIGYWQASEVVQLPSRSATQAGEELSYRHDEQMLALARLTGFPYVPLDHSADFAKAIADANIATIQQSPKDLSWIAATLALLFLIWRMLAWRWTSMRGFLTIAKRFFVSPKASNGTH